MVSGLILFANLPISEKFAKKEDFHCIAHGWRQKSPLHAFPDKYTNKKLCIFSRTQKYRKLPKQAYVCIYIYIYIYIYIFFLQWSTCYNGVSACVFRYQKISKVSQSTSSLLQKKHLPPKNWKKPQRTLTKPHTCSCQISILH